MIDSLLKPQLQPFFEKWADRVLQSGLSANKLTLIGFAFGITAAFCVAMQIYILGLFLILLNRFFDGLAGAAARTSGITPLGSYLDAVCDFVVFGTFVFLFSLGLTSSALAAAFLILSYLVMAVSYFAQATFQARANPLETPRGGLVENTEMIVFMAACCIYPVAFPAFCALFGLACFTAAVLRVAKAVNLLKNS